jgi:excisionase family DNA binding protein
MRRTVVVQSLQVKDNFNQVMKVIRRKKGTMMATATQAINPADQKPLLSVKETAEFLGFSESHIWRQIKNGTLKPLRFGDRVVFSRAYLQRLCEA